MMARYSRRMGLAALLSIAVACGDAPLADIGQRSAEWINEPEIVTTTIPPVNTPRFVDSTELAWANDDIENPNLSDPEALVAEVFGRREGDRFIQASRIEIAAALPNVKFPAVAPYGAEWVSSQLVIENNGVLSRDPTAAFGIWSAEPYTRSRSVAQMVVLRVAIDPEAAAEVAASGDDVSCARFSDLATNVCEVIDVEGTKVWELIGSGGVTLIWFEGEYRYEIFGRDFVPVEDLIRMASETLRLADLRPVSP